MLKDASPYNVQWRGRAAGLHRRRIVRAVRAGRAVGRLPAVLHAVPLPADARGVPRRRLPAVASREPRRDHSPATSGRSSRGATPCGEGCCVTSSCIPSWSARKPIAATMFVPIVGRRLRRRARRRRTSRSMTRLVARLRSRAARSAWQDYRSTCTYDEVDASQKDDFVRRAVGRRRRRLIWDLGCNDGRFSRIAAEAARPRPLRSTRIPGRRPPLPSAPTTRAPRRYCRSSSTLPILHRVSDGGTRSVERCSTAALRTSCCASRSSTTSRSRGTSRCARS